MRRYLVVDDVAAMASAIRALLARDGEVSVDVTGGAGEALWLVQMHRYDLVIIDVHLPEASGAEVLADMRRPGSLNEHAKVLLISGSDTKLEKLAKAHGADAFLVKPFGARELLGAVDELLGAV